MSTKRGPPIEISKREARKLKETLLRLTSKRPHDAALQERDVLVMCLFIEHAFRVGEAARLQIEGFNLLRETVAVYRSKGKVWETQKLQELTLIAAETYLNKLRELDISGAPFPRLQQPADQNPLAVQNACARSGNWQELKT